MSNAKLLCILVLGFSANVDAEEPLPRSFMGFLKPGIYVEVRPQATLSTNGARQPTGYVSINILEKRAFEIASDARVLELAELRKKYPEVKEFVEQSMERSLSNRQPNQDERLPTVRISFDRNTMLYTVVAVGDDYVLVEAESGRKVIPKQNINSIYWPKDLIGLSLLFSYDNAIPGADAFPPRPNR